MAAAKKLIFNFSSEPTPNNYIRKGAATPRRKRAEAVESPAVEVDDNDSPLFVPLSKKTPDQPERYSQPTHASEVRMSSTNVKMNRRADPPKTPARTSMSGYSSQVRTSTYQPVPQTPLRPGALVYRDDGGITREIWQPGDGNGVRDSEFPNKPLFKERYRFFQTEIGPIERGTNSPPHFVALDDKAVWDVFSSKKYTAKDRAAFWPLDFLANGVLRATRRRKGRAANDTEGDTGRVPWIKAGSKNNSMNYYLSGEEGGYEEVVFNSPKIRLGSVNRKATSTGGRKDSNQTKMLTTSAISNLNNGSKTEYATKRKADQPLNPRHNRPKVANTRVDDGNDVNPLDGSEWSPSTKVGGKTVYARYDYGEEAPERINGRLVASGARTSYGQTPRADGAKTPFKGHGARTPYQGSSFEAKTPGQQNPTGTSVLSYGAREALPSQPQPWEVVKRMGEELEQAKGILRMRDAEISNLKAQINALYRDNVEHNRRLILWQPRAT